MVINGSSTKLFAGVGLAVPRLGNVQLRLHFLRRGTSRGWKMFKRDNILIPDAIYFQGNVNANSVFGQTSLGAGVYISNGVVNSYYNPSAGAGITVPGLGVTLSFGLIYDEDHDPSNYDSKFLGRSQSTSLEIPNYASFSYSNPLVKAPNSNLWSPDYSYHILGFGRGTNFGVSRSVYSNTIHLKNHRR